MAASWHPSRDKAHTQTLTWISATKLSESSHTRLESLFARIEERRRFKFDHTLSPTPVEPFRFNMASTQSVQCFGKKKTGMSTSYDVRLAPRIFVELTEFAISHRGRPLQGTAEQFDRNGIEFTSLDSTSRISLRLKNAEAKFGCLF